MSDEITEFSWKLQAVKNLAPNCSFSTNDEGEINWGSGNPLGEPSKTEIDTEIARLKSDYDSKQYQRDRASAYPSIQEQLDMQYHDAVNGTNKWQEAVAKVKTDNPKPE